MKERPILFSSPMVRALLDGSKTMTRRVVKPQPIDADGMPYSKIIGPEMYEPAIYDKNGDMEPGPEIFGIYTEDGEWGIKCPYGQIGDRLWVREAFADLLGTGIEHRPSPDKPKQRIAYAADTAPGSYGDQCRKDYGIKYKPSIHMPRWASRITLEITDVRVERLHDISRGDAMDEGCPFPNMANGDDPRKWFTDLWRQINGHDSWAANPWVWVVEFKVVA